MISRIIFTSIVGKSLEILYYIKTRRRIMKIAIMTDSNSGITLDEAKKLGIFVLPMPFTINGKEFLEGINLTQE